MNFIASLVCGQPDIRAHSVMVRYGKGTFGGPAADAEAVKNKLKISASYLCVPVLGELLAKSCDGDLTVQGTVVARADISDALLGHGLDVLDVSKRGSYKLKVSGVVSPPQLARIYGDFWDAAVLTKIKGTRASMTVGSRIPKPDKYSEPNFCKLTMPVVAGAQSEVLEALAPKSGLQSFESMSVRYEIRIDELVVPEELAGLPASKLRLEAKRKGGLSRVLTVDGVETRSSYEFIA